jgi:activator of 2-hydroxyglutaryl-CoA dehydratase
LSPQTLRQSGYGATRGSVKVPESEHVENSGKGLRLGVDVGGTFTDLLLLDEKNRRTYMAKAPSTPQEELKGRSQAETGFDAPQAPTFRQRKPLMAAE